MHYAISDIHGCIKTLKELIKTIEAVSSDNTYYFLGDYIDRGPDSKSVLDYLIDLKHSKQAIHIIRGNHEEMMLNTYLNNDIEDYLLWMNNGASQTLKNYNVPNGIYHLTSYIPRKYIEFIESMPYFIETEKFILVHAGINFNSDNPFNDKISMIWTREENYNSDLAKRKFIIHGHTQLPKKQILKNIENENKILCIDSGCVYKQIKEYGYLSALNLDTLELISTENIDF